MKRTHQGIVHSPSDLCRFLESPFASWMDRFALERPGGIARDDEAPELRLLMDQGIAFEARYLATLRHAGRDVATLARDDDAAADSAAASPAPAPATPLRADPLRATLDAMRAGREILYQAYLEHDAFAGYPDFLVRVPGASEFGDFHYEPWDTKLGRSPKPHYLIQLCAYAEMLAAVQGRMPETLRVVLGDGAVSAHRTADVLYFHRALKRAYRAAMDAFEPAARPVPDPTADHGHWQSHADTWLDRCDHLVRVANIARSQIKKLEAAGICTMAQLAAAAKATQVPGLDDGVFDRVRRQARLQCRSAGKPRPEFEVLPPPDDGSPHGLELLPLPSPLDVAFDMEGYPFDVCGEGAAGGEGDGPAVTDGLEYLFGASFRDGKGAPHFKDVWAHDAAEEKRAFEGVVDWVHARWREDRSMHVYHYAAYEPNAFCRLAQRHATREAQVDDLLRHGVLVDLYTVVRRAVRIGEPRYSLKNVERLYRDARSGDVTSAMDSVVWYANWRASGEPRDAAHSPILAKIREYNRDDCESTLELADWLRGLQERDGFAYAPLRETKEADELPSATKEADARRTALSDRLLARAAEAEDGGEAENGGASIDALLAHLVWFHRREAKPAWWALFDRAAMTDDERIADFHCIGGLRRTGSRPIAVRRSLGFRYTFPADQDTRIEAGSTVQFAHDPFLSPRIEELDLERGEVLLLVSKGKYGDETFPERAGLILHELVGTKALEEAIEDLARARIEGTPLPRALDDLLARRPPRLRGAGQRRGAQLVREGESAADAVRRLVPLLDRTSLAIQGPPGSGKTRLAAEVIVDLVRSGRSVGVASHSHAAIDHLLATCLAIGGRALSCVKAGPDGDALRTRFPWVHCAENPAAAERWGSDDCRLIGGTPWLFARPEMEEALDFLFVDEAGQVTLANLVAMARSARNLVLVGDPMQLAQPVQGLHPGEAGLSCLEVALDGHAVVPAERGVFLDVSHRMHPDLCGVISDAIYEGRLRAAEGNRARVLDFDPPSGILFVPVEHDGNTQCCDEEVDAIARFVKRLVGRSYTDTTGSVAGALAHADLLVVAPYNLQVRRLRARLPKAVRVGTVDKFQGQEGKVVLVSMCASNAHESPRGLSFLFDPHRLNVALSRAQCLAVVFGSPLLATPMCSSVAQLKLVNLFCRVAEEGRRGASES